VPKRKSRKHTTPAPQKRHKIRSASTTKAGKPDVSAIESKQGRQQTTPSTTASHAKSLLPMETLAPTEHVIHIKSSGKIRCYVKYCLTQLAKPGTPSVLIQGEAATVTKAVTVVELIKKHYQPACPDQQLHQQTIIGCLVQSPTTSASDLKPRAPRRIPVIKTVLRVMRQADMA
jgi:DNA-binding protein